MPALSLMIKPASSNCNLRCTYCFYHSLAENRQTKSFGYMSLDTLETLVKKALSFTKSTCSFAFQGGEPTLVGLDFFEKLIYFQKKYNKNGIDISNSIQTNGTLIDDKWMSLLKDNNFLIGLSLDGTKDIHNLSRVDAKNKGTFNRVFQTVNLFNKYQIDYNILFVVTAASARYANRIYNFFKKNRFSYLQFIPCLDPLGEEPFQRPYSLTPSRFAIFLKNIFDLWYTDFKKGDLVSIRYFDNLLGMFMGHSPENCGMSGVCQIQYIIEADGGVYPCDFYANDQWYLGNLKDMGFTEIMLTDKAREFVEVSQHVDDKCKNCQWLHICRGGCRRNREPFVKGKPALNYFCKSYKEFFDYAYPRFVEMAHLVRLRHMNENYSQSPR